MLIGLCPSWSAISRVVRPPSSNSADDATSAVAAYLEQHDLIEAVHSVHGREEDPRLMTPATYLLDSALAALGAEPGHAVMIGDSDTDIEAAQAAGVPIVAYANKPAKAERFAAADAVTDSMSAVAVTTELDHGAGPKLAELTSLGSRRRAPRRIAGPARRTCGTVGPVPPGTRRGVQLVVSTELFRLRCFRRCRRWRRSRRSRIASARGVSGHFAHRLGRVRRIRISTPSASSASVLSKVIRPARQPPCVRPARAFRRWCVEVTRGADRLGCRGSPSGTAPGLPVNPAPVSRRSRKVLPHLRVVSPSGRG